MQVETTRFGAELIVSVAGNVDSANADQLISALSALDGVQRVSVDLAQVDYISSAGLRALLMAQKAMKKAGGQMVIYHAQPAVVEIFNITGFSNFLTLK